MSTAKPSGLKVPSKISKPPGTTAPKTNPSTGKNLPMCIFFTFVFVFSVTFQRIRLYERS